MRRRCLQAGILIAGFVLAACSQPPHKEMDQAQGAIDAARAAGADRYAANEYSAATEALKNANGAVAAGDYRLALSYALESHEHAQNAARDAADAKARVRVEVERMLADIAALLQQAKDRMADAERARVPRRLRRQAAAEIAAVDADVQEAREALGDDGYLAARPGLEEAKARLEKALAGIDEAIAAQPRRRRR